VNLTLGNDQPTGTRASRLHIRRADQRCEGRRPFRSTPQEKSVIEMMEAWRKERKSFAEIASGLNAEGVPMNPHQCHLSDASSVEESYS